MTTNTELLTLAKVLNIKNFLGVICRDEFKNLPKMEADAESTGIYNFNDSSKPGSHWAAWYRNKNNWYHFCSYGSDPCLELKEYAKQSPIKTHTYKLQGWEDTNCGEWCILFCYLMSQEKLTYEDIILFFFNKCHSEKMKKE